MTALRPLLAHTAQRNPPAPPIAASNSPSVISCAPRASGSRRARGGPPSRVRARSSARASAPKVRARDRQNQRRNGRTSSERRRELRSKPWFRPARRRHNRQTLRADARRVRPGKDPEAVVNACMAGHWLDNRARACSSVTPGRRRATTSIHWDDRWAIDSTGVHGSALPPAAER